MWNQFHVFCLKKLIKESREIGYKWLNLLHICIEFFINFWPSKMIFTQMTKTKMILLKVNQMKILTMAKILLKYGFDQVDLDQDVIDLAFTMTPNHILEIRNTRKSLTDTKNLESASTILKSLWLVTHWKNLIWLMRQQEPKDIINTIMIIIISRLE